MFRLLILLLTLTLLPLGGLAEAPVTLADDLTGVYVWPEGASETEASYVYRFTYPQFAGDEGIAHFKRVLLAALDASLLALVREGRPVALCTVKARNAVLANNLLF